MRGVNHLAFFVCKKLAVDKICFLLDNVEILKRIKCI